MANRKIKSHCCNADMVYLGTGKGPINVFLNGVHNYVCTKCGMLEWNTEKQPSKYAWYNYDKEKLKKLLKEWL